MGITFEPVTTANAAGLWEMLYLVIYIPPGVQPPGREIVREPDLAHYVQGWGRAGDLGFYAMQAAQPVGAAWLRLWRPGDRGYGWVDDQTPELTLAVVPGLRGQGIGSRLLEHLLAAARSQYEAVSLSVTAANPALRLYQRAGFRRVGGDEITWTMLMIFDERGNE